MKTLDEIVNLVKLPLYAARKENQTRSEPRSFIAEFQIESERVFIELGIPLGAAREVLRALVADKLRFSYRPEIPLSINDLASAAKLLQKMFRCSMPEAARRTRNALGIFYKITEREILSAAGSHGARVTHSIVRTKKRRAAAERNGTPIPTQPPLRA